MNLLARRVLKLGYYVTLVLVVAVPVLLDAEHRRFVRANAELEGADWIRIVRTGDLGWTPAISGEVRRDRIDEFIRRNDLQADSPSFDWWLRRGGGPFGDWERHWPQAPEWFARVKPRSNAACKVGCDVYCQLDRRSGRIWIAVEMPDLAGD